MHRGEEVRERGMNREREGEREGVAAYKASQGHLHAPNKAIKLFKFHQTKISAKLIYVHIHFQLIHFQVKIIPSGRERGEREREGGRDDVSAPSSLSLGSRQSDNNLRIEKKKEAKNETESVRLA